MKAKKPKPTHTSTGQPIVRGWRHPRSNYSLAKDAAEHNARRIKQIDDEIRDLQAEQRELQAKQPELDSAFSQARQVVDAEVAEDKSGELLSLARQIDEASTPEKWKALRHLAAELHSGGFLRASYEARELMIKRLRGEAPGMPPIRFKTAEAMVQSWLVTSAEAAA